MLNKNDKQIQKEGMLPDDNDDAFWKEGIRDVCRGQDETTHIIKKISETQPIDTNVIKELMKAIEEIRVQNSQISDNRSKGNYYEKSSRTDCRRQSLQQNGVIVDFVNCNPDCPTIPLCDFSEKFYFDVLLDDKAGFEAEKDWIKIYNYLISTLQ